MRLALGGLFDFEWANKNLFSGAYQRTRSYYDGSVLSSFGTPASDAEKALLQPYADKLLPEIMAGTWAPPASDGSGRDRAFLKKGFDALKKAGYELKDGTMIGPDGKPLTFEILLNGKAGEAVAGAWQRSLEKLGIAVTIRSVDSAQYLQRQRVYDFDAMLMTYTSSLSPGTEQQFRWGSASRDADGTYNFAGVADPAIDAMIEHLLKARSQEDFVTAVRAYDRLLLSGAYVVPLYFQPDQWVARWAGIKHPDATPIYGYQLPAWWRDRPTRSTGERGRMAKGRIDGRTRKDLGRRDLGRRLPVVLPRPEAAGHRASPRSATSMSRCAGGRSSSTRRSRPKARTASAT